MAIQALDAFDEENLRILYGRSVSFPYMSQSFVWIPRPCTHSYGFHTQMLLVSAYVTIALFYEVYKRVRNNEDIETYNRNLLMVNILLMLPGLSYLSVHCLHFSFPVRTELILYEHVHTDFALLTYSHVFGYFAAALDDTDKTFFDLSIVDFSDWALYCFIFFFNALSCHHTINIMRICYEKTYSNTTWCHRHFFGIFIAHLAVYITLYCISRGNLALMVLPTLIIDYPEHLCLLCLLLYRLVVVPNDELHQRWRRRNMWAAAAVFLHISSLLPLMIIKLTGPSVLLESASHFWIYVEYVPMYAMMFAFLYCWYKVIIHTPNEFVGCDEKDLVTHVDHNSTTST